MLGYRSLDEIVRHPGLRIVLVKGTPSPWGQAAKTIFEVKGLEYVAAPWMPGEPNPEIVAWGGEASAPIVAWANEKPIHRWLDILYLAERLAPQPAMLPADVTQRALMIGLAHEICGERGIGWNRRLQIFAPMLRAESPPEGIVRMGAKYGQNDRDVQLAGQRNAAVLRTLTAQLKAQDARGVQFFIGDALSALDIYWTAFSVLLAPLAPEQCPISDVFREALSALDPATSAALDPVMLEHRDRIFTKYFRSPMEL